MSRDFVVLATYSGKPEHLVYLIMRIDNAHREWKDGGSSVYTPIKITVRDEAGRWSTVLPGGAIQFMFWRIRVKVDICRSGTCICLVVGNPQLGFNRFESSLLLGEEDSIN